MVGVIHWGRFRPGRRGCGRFGAFFLRGVGGVRRRGFRRGLRGRAFQDRLRGLCRGGCFGRGGGFVRRGLDALPFQNVARHHGRVPQFGGGLFLVFAARGVKIFLVIVQGFLPFLRGQRGQQFFQPGQISVFPHNSSPLNSLLILPV